MAGFYTNGLPLVTSLTGAELLPVDTQYSQGVAPQVGAISVSALGAGTAGVGNFRNAIDCGDFTINPWQRGTSFTGITNTLTWTADRFAAIGGASSSISVSRQAITAIPGFTQALQWGRAAANANTAQINLGQALESSVSAKFQTRNVTLSFYALAGANFSSSLGKLNVVLAYGTGTDQSTANLIAGSWTGQTSLTPLSQTVTVVSSGVQTAIGSAVSYALPTTVWQRFAFTYLVPAAATQLGFYVNFSPVGTAGSNDWIQFAGFQLEDGQYASIYEHKSPLVDLEVAQRFAYVINEAAAGVVQTPVGTTQGTTTTCTTYIPFPAAMRAAPTYTNTLSASTFKLVSASQTATALSTPFSATLAANTVNGASVNFTTTGMTAKDSCFIVGAAGSGSMVFTADL